MAIKYEPPTIDGINFFFPLHWSNSDSVNDEDLGEGQPNPVLCAEVKF